MSQCNFRRFLCNLVNNVRDTINGGGPFHQQWTLMYCTAKWNKEKKNEEETKNYRQANKFAFFLFAPKYRVLSFFSVCSFSLPFSFKSMSENQQHYYACQHFHLFVRCFFFQIATIKKKMNKFQAFIQHFMFTIWKETN